METWRHRDIETWRHGDMETWRHGKKHGRGDMQTLRHQTEAKAIFLDPFTACSSSKWKFVVCPFVVEDTNRSYPFANGLNGLAHLCFKPYLYEFPNIKKLIFRKISFQLSSHFVYLFELMNISTPLSSQIPSPASSQPWGQPPPLIRFPILSSNILNIPPHPPPPN